MAVAAGDQHPAGGEVLAVCGDRQADVGVPVDPLGPGPDHAGRQRGDDRAPGVGRQADQHGRQRRHATGARPDADDQPVGRLGRAGRLDDAEPGHVGGGRGARPPGEVGHVAGPGPQVDGPGGHGVQPAAAVLGHDGDDRQQRRQAGQAADERAVGDEHVGIGLLCDDGGPLGRRRQGHDRQHRVAPQVPPQLLGRDGVGVNQDGTDDGGGHDGLRRGRGGGRGGDGRRPVQIRSERAGT